MFFNFLNISSSVEEGEKGIRIDCFVGRQEKEIFPICIISPSPANFFFMMESFYLSLNQFIES